MWSQANEIQSSCEIRRDSTDKKFKKIKDNNRKRVNVILWNKIQHGL